MKKKIIFIDIDLTLKDLDQELSLRNIAAVKQTKEKGHEVVLASGRSSRFVTDMAKAVGADAYLIASNGAEIVDMKKNESILQKQLHPDVVLDFYKIAKEHNITIFLNSFNKRYCNFTYLNCELITDENANHIASSGNIAQIVLNHPKYDVMKKIQKIVREYKNISVVNESVALIEDMPNCEYFYIDISTKNTSKGAAILKLIDHLGYDISDTIAIGDNYNDLSMADVAHTFVAVENAVEPLKRKANIMTDSCLNDGVAKYLETLNESE